MRYALLWLWCLAPALAQRGAVPDVYVGAEVTPARVAVGGTVLYRAYVTVQDGITSTVSVVPPEFTGFEQLGPLKQESQPGQSATTDVFSCRLRPQRSGTLTIAPFLARYEELDGARRSIESTPVQLVVETTAAAPPDASRLRPDRAPADLPDPSESLQRWLLVLLLGCSALAAGLLVSGWLARRRARPAPVAPPPARVPAHQTAYRRLQELRAERLAERELRETFHVRLAAILRDYVAEQYGVSSLESTSSETVLALFRRNLPQGLLQAVKELLGRCDGVKFAEQQPGPTAMNALLNDAERFVQQSSGAEPGPAGAGSGGEGTERAGSAGTGGRS